VFAHVILQRGQNIVLEFWEVAGTGWRTSQCSRILPASSKRKMSDARSLLTEQAQVSHMHKCQIAVRWRCASPRKGRAACFRKAMTPSTHRHQRIVLDVSRI